QKIIDAEMGLGRKLVQVGFVRRFDDQHLAVKRTIESGAIGCPILFKGWHRGVGVPTANDVTLIGSAIHDLDSARWLLGQEIEEVFVRGRNTDQAVSHETSDLLLLQLFLSGNCLATIEHWQTKTTYAYEVGVEVVGELGTVFIGPPHGPVVRSNRTHAMQVESDWRERFAIGYVSELEAWIASINSNNYIGPDAWDGYISLVAAEGCIMALQSGSPCRLSPAMRPALYGDDIIPGRERTKSHAT
ncbi:MAG: Gfo/Idh/MocA family oxidoreductase, partial [Anaerolineales bacterium]|nr:Gfo/Idh/MocA family oxidoreductase [Anaerolineales bacterium]